MVKDLPDGPLMPGNGLGYQCYARSWDGSLNRPGRPASPKGKIPRPDSSGGDLRLLRPIYRADRQDASLSALWIVMQTVTGSGAGGQSRGPGGDATASAAQSWEQPIEIVPLEDAAPCRVSFPRRHAPFAGTTGSGKSGGLNLLMGNLTACADAVIWAIDLKKGMELRPWASCIDRLATTPEEAASLMENTGAREPQAKTRQKSSQVRFA